MTTPRIPVAPNCRVLLDNDWGGDPDGLVALAHHVLSPANRVVAVTSSFLDPMFVGLPSRAEDGAALARELLHVIGGLDALPVHAGSEEPFGDGSGSAAADAIVAEARRDDDRDTDPAAAEFVLGHEALDVHQFPLETYRRCAYSVAELDHDLAEAGALGRWLHAHFTSPPDRVRVGGVWPLGDSPPVLVTALTTESSTCSTDGRRHIYTDVDTRALFADLLAKLRIHERTSHER